MEERKRSPLYPPHTHTLPPRAAAEKETLRSNMGGAKPQQELDSFFGSNTSTVSRALATRFRDIGGGQRRTEKS
eukprot:756483-Hanusia_phi.AAC.4